MMTSSRGSGISHRFMNAPDVRCDRRASGQNSHVNNRQCRSRIFRVAFFLGPCAREVCLDHDPNYGISGNSKRLGNLHQRVRRCWQKWLSRRSNHGSVTWVAFARLLAHLPIPRPRIVDRRRYAAS
jgi:hypothetical protein